MARDFRDRLALWLRPAIYLGQNPVSLAGAVLTSSSAATLLGFWFFEMVAHKPLHPYAGIVFFLVLPAIFVLGLILMPIGGFARRYKLRKAGVLPTVYPTIDLKRPVLRRAVILVFLLSFINVAILGVASYKSVEHMDSVQFCGQTCHSVMQPEYTAYADSPHSRVACVECHIGAGAPWFVRAKISGVRQLWAVNLKTYSRPIPSPVRNLRPARETCERCHWPEKFTGDKFLVKTKYAADEANTPSTSVLLLKIGGRTAQGLVGIHGRHLETQERVRYVSTDERRQVIPNVTYLGDDGKTVEYVSEEVKTTPAQLVAAEHRKMDCMDCHNRPSHSFILPERALDEAMSEGRISPTLPWIKKQAVAALRTDYPDRQTAGEKITGSINEFYRAKYPDVYKQHRALVESAAEQTKAIYMRNVFPSMKIQWGTYPNNIGHDDYLGCFRCHDGKHKTSAGKVITDDCSACHQILAMEEKEPKILAEMGLK